MDDAQRLATARAELDAVVEWGEILVELQLRLVSGDCSVQWLKLVRGIRDSLPASTFELEANELPAASG